MIRRPGQEFVAVPKNCGEPVHVRIDLVSLMLVELSAHGENGQFFGYAAVRPSGIAFSGSLDLRILKITGAEQDDVRAHLSSATLSYDLVPREQYEGPEAVRMRAAFAFPRSGLTSHHLR